MSQLITTTELTNNLLPRLPQDLLKTLPMKTKTKAVLNTGPSQRASIACRTCRLRKVKVLSCPRLGLHQLNQVFLPVRRSVGSSESTM